MNSAPVIIDGRLRRTESPVQLAAQPTMNTRVFIPWLAICILSSGCTGLLPVSEPSVNSDKRPSGLHRADSIVPQSIDFQTESDSASIKKYSRSAQSTQASNSTAPQSQDSRIQGPANPASDKSSLEEMLTQLVSEHRIDAEDKDELASLLAEAPSTLRPQLRGYLQLMANSRKQQQDQKHQLPSHALAAKSSSWQDPTQSASSPENNAEDEGPIADEQNPLRAESQPTDAPEAEQRDPSIATPTRTIRLDHGRTHGDHLPANGTLAKTFPGPKSEDRSRLEAASADQARVRRANHVHDSIENGRDGDHVYEPSERIEVDEAGATQTPKPHWRQSLADTIRILENSGRTDTSTDEGVERAVALRMLYLASNDSERAIAPVSGVDAHEQEFWKHLFHGLSLLTAKSRIPSLDRRAASALRELRAANAELASASTLDVKNLHFCTDVYSYGRFKEFSEYVFTPGQLVLLYVEVDNFTTKPVDNGFLTSLNGSYQIFDSTGREVAYFEFDQQQEVCGNRRRDYFVPYKVIMPRRVYPGQYTLKLTMEDALAHKLGQSSIRFKIQE